MQELRSPHPSSGHSHWRRAGWWCSGLVAATPFFTPTPRSVEGRDNQRRWVFKAPRWMGVTTGTRPSPRMRPLRPSPFQDVTQR